MTLQDLDLTLVRIEDQTHVTTCEGHIVDIANYKKGKYIEIPLSRIKRTQWVESMKMYVPEPFREVYERKTHYYVDIETNEKLAFENWAFKEIK